MSRVLLIGNGAREHAIASALKRSGVEILAHMDRLNPGIAEVADETSIGSTIDYTKLPMDLRGIDYAVIGPELPLEHGISDFLESQGVPCVAPSQAAAKIETSKAFARRMLEKVYPSANPEYAIIRSVHALREFEEKIGFERVVVKPDGLTGGKGVKVFGEHLNTRRELEKYATSLLANHGIVILEEKLEGTEFTVQAFVDGKNFATMPLVRDYKRAHDGDTGPNTGSMGSYSRETHTLDYVDDRDMEIAEDIIATVVKRFKRFSSKIYKGILYGQFMKTSEGIKVIEFNARFGDPEAMNVLSILSSSFDEVCLSIIDGNLTTPEFDSDATVCIYVVPEGYPGKDVVSDWPIEVDPGITSEVYYGSVYEKEGKIFTTGSRALGILGKGATVADARDRAYEDAHKIRGRIRYRKDIAGEV